MSIASLWEQMWESQGRRCGSCNRKVKLGDTAKNDYSFKIVCQDCYNKPHTMVIMDEFANYPTGRMT